MTLSPTPSHSIATSVPTSSTSVVMSTVITYYYDATTSHVNDAEEIIWPPIAIAIVLLICLCVGGIIGGIICYR